MSQTTFLHLTKPAGTDVPDVDDLNDNADKIDTWAAGVLDSVYPVGSIYMSLSSTDPGTLFGGSWTAIPDAFLLGVGTIQTTSGQTGGESTHQLSAGELPVITGTARISQNIAVNSAGADRLKDASGAFSVTKTSATDIVVKGTAYDNTGSASTNNTLNLSIGGGQAHNNMPPYFSVYMWYRDA